MDPFTLATSFGQLVSLLVDYSGQKSGRQTLELREFLRWLVENGHSETMQALERNEAAMAGMHAAFSEGKDELSAKLNDVLQRLAVLAAASGSLAQVAQAMHPDVALSSQMRDLLIAFEQSKAIVATESKRRGGPYLIFSGGTSAQEPFAPNEPRLFEDDLAYLVRHGLITVTQQSNGTRHFRLTRSGSNLGLALLAQQKSHLV